MQSKKILALGDFQCGHLGGLTPPAWHISQEREEEEGLTGWRNVQEVTWKRFKRIACKKEYDGLIVNGDAIDGHNFATAGRGLICSDIKGQTDMATHIIKQIHLKDNAEIAMTFGTPYHTGKLHRHEQDIADRVGASIQPAQTIKIYDHIIRARHKIGRSGTPVGGDIMLRKKMLEELQWEHDHSIPPADIYIFSHAHYFRHIEDAKWHAIILPALQTWTEFGSTQCNGVIHWGIVELTMWENGDVFVQKDLMELGNVTLNKPLEW